jgi:ribokinase
VSAADVVVCQLEIPLAAVQAAQKACTGVFVLNPAPARQLPAELLARTDVLVVNETEYETVLGIALPTRLDDIAAVAARPGAPKVIVATLGPRGAAVCTDGAVTHVTPPPVTVVDSTGAGDTFVGALAAELARGSDVLTASRMAVIAASLSTQSLGATAGMPHRDEVVHHLELSKSPEPA